MKMFRRIGIYFLLCTLGYLAQPTRAFSGTAQAAAETGAQRATTERDGQHDFDFNFGTWKTHISRLQHPLTGSTEWVELDGTVVVRKIWDGRAQLEEVEADGAKGHFEDLGLFLYSPQAHQWSLNFANSKIGTLGQPSIGEFKNGRGEFFDQEAFNGRTILVRIIWSDITADSHRFEQAFSDDGGKTWEPNVIAKLTRTKEDPVQAPPHSADMEPGQHDFDFEIGAWKIHLKRLVNPLTGSNTWVEFDGTTATRKVWDGRAELEEFETDGASGHIEGLTLRLYNPQSHQWSLFWANGRNGILAMPPTVGDFKNGRGDFYDQEPINGREIFVRYAWSEITPNSAHFEQAFSDDGGKTWEVNWITDQTRAKDESR